MSRQTRAGSLAESAANIAVGFSINWTANMLVLPLFGFAVTGGEAFGIGCVFTVISLVRSYVLRRWFNGLKFGHTHREIPMPIGNVHSNARGSGARYNDGKPALELIPLRMIADSLPQLLLDQVAHDTEFALKHLGAFQTTGNVGELYLATRCLRRYWRDCARVFEYGRAKYAAWNWSKGMAWSIPLACAARHALAILEGERDDPESGLPHVGHLLCNVVMLRHFVDTYPEGNDLPPAEHFERREAPRFDASGHNGIYGVLRRG